MIEEIEKLHLMIQVLWKIALNFWPVVVALILMVVWESWQAVRWNKKIKKLKQLQKR